ncbi:MAG: hypothetical protein NTV29_03280 [Planctomycetota bacterium]|nr:hypothetical protein [Planctomycetota bacterium]
MTRRCRGQRHWVPVERRTPIDVSIVAKRVPSFPIVSRVDVSAVETWRQTLKAQGLRIGWNALLAHAYGKVSQAIPELRDVYVARPVAYVYRHPEPIASLTIHRKDAKGTERLIWARIASPHAISLQDLQSKIDHFATAPIQEVFTDGLRLERRIALLRRLNWYLLMRWCGRKRAKHLGTFSLSSLGHLGALNLHHPIVTATSLAMGPISNDGYCDLALICDHRVIDGVLACRSQQLLMDTIRNTMINSRSS